MKGVKQIMLLMAEVGTSSISTVLETLGAVFTYLMSQLSDLVSLIMSQPLLMIPIGITLAFVVVRFFRMIFSLAR